MSINLVLVDDDINNYDFKMLEKDEYRKFPFDIEPDFFTSNSDESVDPGAKYIAMALTQEGEYDKIICISSLKSDVQTSFDDANERVLKIKTSAGFFNIIKDVRIYAVQVVEIAS